MKKSLLILDGHPDGAPDRLCHALCQAYAEGANAAGHRVERIELAHLEFPLLRSRKEFEEEPATKTIAEVQAAMLRADHWLIVYPLWLGGMPALLKALLEQTFRPEFAFEGDNPLQSKGRLRGHSARIVVTMGMPSWAYRWYFGAHSLKSLERNILKFVGVGPIRESLFGMVELASDAKRRGWLETMHELGRKGA